MKKIFRELYVKTFLALCVLLFPLVAFAQNQGSPTFNNLTVNGVMTGGGGALTNVATRPPRNSDDYTHAYFPLDSVDNINLSNAGSGCTSAPTLAFNAPATGGTQATATVVMNGTTVFGAILNNPGWGYSSTNLPTVTATGGGCTTEPTFKAHYAINASLWNYNGQIYQMGQGSIANQATWTYLQTPKYPLDAVAYPVTAAVLNTASPGSGYAPAQTITLLNGTVLTITNTQVVALPTIAAAGSGGTNGTATVTGTTGTGTKFQASVTISGGSISAVNSVTVAGAYTANPTTLTAEPVTGGGLTGAQLSIQMSPGTLSVTTGGNWHCYTAAAQSQVSSSGSGTGATFNITAAWPMFAYGTHRLTACYTANADLVVTRASDSSTATIGFVSDALDVSTMQNFCAGTTCTAVWVDQSGRGNSPTSGSLTIDPNVTLGGLETPLCNYCNIGLPSGVSMVASNNTVMMLGKVLTGSYLWSIGGDSATTNNSGLLFGGSCCGNTITSTYTPSYAAEVIGLDVSSGSSMFGTDGEVSFECTSVCTGGNTVTGGNFGAGTFVFGAGFAFPRALTSVEYQAVQGALEAESNAIPQGTDTCIFNGDSRTAGTNETNDVNYPFWFSNQFFPCRVFDLGVSGYTAANNLSAFWTAGNDADLMLMPHGQNSWSIQWIGINDIGNSVPVATIESNIAAFQSLVHGFGYKVAQFTEVQPLPNTNTSALNTWITGSSAADTIVNEALNYSIWNSGYSPVNLMTYPHPNSYGYNYIAADVESQLATVWH